MSSKLMRRRQFLTLPLAALIGSALPPFGRQFAKAQSLQVSYAIDAGILYGLVNVHLDGTISEAVDRTAGRYDFKAVGEGDGIANRLEAGGVLRDGRWQPLRGRSWLSVKGRESRSDITYDYARRAIDYHFRGETFFLRRLRVADDVVPIPAGLHVDDAVSATLNYADGVWAPRSDGAFETWVVRRKRNENEGPDDVEKFYRAELVPFRFRVSTEPGSGQTVAALDFTRFSSWARRDHPAHVTFGRDLRPVSMAFSMILGTSVNIRMATGRARAA